MNVLLPPRIGLIAMIFLTSLSAWAAQKGDIGFHPRSKNPTFIQSHPKVLFDRGHNNLAAADGRYNALMELLKSDGYEVETSHVAISESLLAHINIFYVAAPLGAISVSDPLAKNSPFSEGEIVVVRKWVEAGGSLFVSGDHPPMGQAVSALMLAFGIHGSWGSTESQALAISQYKDPSIMVFPHVAMESNHPVLTGRSKSERVEKIAVFSGQSLSGKNESVGLLKFGPDAIDRFENETTSSAEGRFEVLCSKIGKGRVVAFGDATLFTAKTDTKTGLKHGLNYPNADNVQFALNVFHWMSGLLDP